MAWYQVTTYNCPKCGADTASEQLDLTYVRSCLACHAPVIRSVDSVAKDWFFVFAAWGFGAALAILAILMGVLWFRTPNATINWLLTGFPVVIGAAIVAGALFGALVAVVGCIWFYMRNYRDIVQSGKPSFSKLALYTAMTGIVVFPVGAVAIILGSIGLRKDGRNGTAITSIVLGGLGGLEVALLLFLILSGVTKVGGSN